MTAFNINEGRHLKRRKVYAWGVHLFTASGAVMGLLSIFAITEHDWLQAIIWMTASAFIDSLDGTLARRFQVKGLIPDFDGALLDNIVDYFTYAIIPALFIYEAGLLPEQWALFGASVIVLTSGFQFCQADAKTDDHYFKGFPSYWNVLIYYMILLGSNPIGNLATILICGILVFVPIKFIYPSRTLAFQRLTLALGVIWGIIQLVMLFTYPHHSLPLLWGSFYFPVYYVGISLYLMLRPSRP
jgi:phosphatidylcholine synthase